MRPAVLALALAACSQDMARIRDVDPAQARPREPDDGGVPNGTDGGGPMIPGAATDLPCEIDALLASRCRGCHRNPPVGGAPMPLVTHADLVASRGGTTVAERALARMNDPLAPMPPGSAPSVPPMERAAFSAWVQGGAPSASCLTDGGVPDAAPVDASQPSLTCSSGTFWTRGDRGSPLMHPGRACITCHASSDDDDTPNLAVGGTVYPTVREPNDCIGAGDSGATVVITDARGVTYSLPVNTSGNFLLHAGGTGFRYPYRAKVVANGRERAMQGARDTGDCNSCHTPDGRNGAPGRIMLP